MAMNKKQIGDWLKRYEAMMRVKPADEASISSHRQQINRLGRELDGLALQSAPSLLPARATLARMQRNYDWATEIWQEHARLNPADAVTATLNIADMQFEKSEVAAARATLDTVSGCNDPLYDKIQEKLSQTEHLLKASAQYCEALEYFERGKREAFGTSVLSALDLLHGETISTHPQIVGLVEDLSSACTKKPPADDTEIPLPETGDGPDPVAIFAAGFGWSGSGAVFDFLRQHQLAEAFSTRELSIFGAGEGDVLKCLVAIERKPKKFKRTLASTICVGVLGLTSRSDKGVAHLRKSKSRSLLSEFTDESGNIENLLAGARRFTRTCVRLNLKDTARISGYVGAAREFFEYIFKLKQGENKFLLFSNAISGPGIEVIRVLPESSRAIASVRDVRDAYADRFLAGRRWDAETFIRSYNRKRRRYDGSMSIPEVSEKVIQVQFEDLILDREYRRDLLLKLGMNPELLNEDGQYFDSEKSVKNIGRHPQFENLDAINSITKELGLYLYSRNGSLVT